MSCDKYDPNMQNQTCRQKYIGTYIQTYIVLPLCIELEIDAHIRIYIDTLSEMLETFLLCSLPTNPHLAANLNSCHS